MGSTNDDSSVSEYTVGSRGRGDRESSGVSVSSSTSEEETTRRTMPRQERRAVRAISEGSTGSNVRGSRRRAPRTSGDEQAGGEHEQTGDGREQTGGVEVDPKAIAVKVANSQSDHSTRGGDSIPT